MSATRTIPGSSMNLPLKLIRMAKPLSPASWLIRAGEILCVRSSEKRTLLQHSPRVAHLDGDVDDKVQGRLLGVPVEEQMVEVGGLASLFYDK